MKALDIRGQLPYVNLSESSNMNHSSTSKILKYNKKDGTPYEEKAYDRAVKVRQLKEEFYTHGTTFQRKEEIIDELGMGSL
jgi:hypothetical protein